GVSRRKFLTFAGGLAGVTILFDACKKDEDDKTVVTPGSNTVELGSGDAGLLNYAFLLQQLQADFYIKLMSNRYADMPAHEYYLFFDIKAHEIAQSEFLRNLLDTKAIKNLEFDFSSVDFNSRQSVFEMSQMLEDTVVSGYIGAAKLFATPDNLMYMSKMCSVQARHAAVIRNYVKEGSFADPSDETGRDAAI